MKLGCLGRIGAFVVVVSMMILGTIAPFIHAPSIASAQASATYPLRFMDVSVQPPAPLANVQIWIYPHGAAQIFANVVNRQPNGTSGTTDTNGFIVPQPTLFVGVSYDIVTNSPNLPFLTVTAPQTTAWTIGAPASGPPGPVGPSGQPGFISATGVPPVQATATNGVITVSVTTNPVFQGKLSAGDLQATNQTLGCAFFGADGTLSATTPSCGGGGGGGAIDRVTPAPSANITVVDDTGPTAIIGLASPVATALPSSILGMDINHILQNYAPPATPYPTPIPTCAGTTCSFSGYTLTVPTPAPTCAGTTCSFSGLTLTVPTPIPTCATANCSFSGLILTVPTQTTPTPFPSATALAGGGQQNVCITNTGTLTVGGTCTTPYPTPVPTCAGTTCSFSGYTLTVPTPIATCANTNCSFAGLTLTVATQTTPTPLPSPNFTPGNGNCTVTNAFPTTVTTTCTTPTPAPSLAGWVMVVAPTATSMAVGVVTEPFRFNPGMTNPRALGTHVGCDTAGTGGSAMAWTWESNPSDDLTGAWATVVPIPTASFASNAKLAGGSTFGPTALPTSTDAAHITWFRARVTVAPTTPVSGTCRFFLDGDQTNH